MKSILKDLSHCIDITSENSSFDVAAIDIGINDIINNENSFSIDNVLQNIKGIALKCRSYAKEKY